MAHRTLVYQYVFALLCIGVAMVIGVAFESLLGDGRAFAMAMLAVMLAGWYGGFGPALLASLVGVSARRDGLWSLCGFLFVSLPEGDALRGSQQPGDEGYFRA